MGNFLEALGVKLHLVVDDEATAKHAGKIEAHRKQQPLASTVERLAKKIRADFARKGAQARTEAMSPEARSRAARKAAKARWRKRRAT